MDLSGMAALHKAPPAAVLIRLQNAIERELRLTVSIGLSYNKFLAKLASDLDKPRGFAVIGKADALDVLAPLPVERLPGVGKVGAQSLHAIGAHRISDLRRIGLSSLRARLGDWGERLFQLAQAHDDRRVDPDGERKSISAETTFEDDIADVESLEDVLWALSEKVAARARASNLAGKTVTLKLRTARFQSVARQKKLDDPTLLAARVFETGRGLLAGVADGRAAFRLIGIGLSDFVDAATADRGDMFDTATPKRAAAEAAIAKARDKFGKNAVVSGRTLKNEDDD
jgi:DNA polymerase-4